MELIDHRMIEGGSQRSIRVNDRVIRDADLAMEMQYHPADTEQEARELAAQALVIRELLVSEAQRLGIDEASVETQADELPEQAQIRHLLELEVLTPAPDDLSCRTYFENNRTVFKTPDIYEVRHILLAAPTDDQEEREAACFMAEGLIRELMLNPEKFTELAQQHSACPSKEQGGSLGQISKGQTTPEFERQIFAMGEGLAQEPIASRYGVHVVWVERHIPGDLRPFEQVQGQISGYLATQVRLTAVRQYMRQLVGRAQIEGFEMPADDSPLVQ